MKTALLFVPPGPKNWCAMATKSLSSKAPGWAAVEGSGLLEEFFQKIAEGGDVTALAAEYDEKIGALLNG